MEKEYTNTKLPEHLRVSVTDLRIGNYVKLNDNYYHDLEEDGYLTPENNIWKIERIDIDGDISIRNEIENLFEYVNINEIEGIILDDELLDKIKIVRNKSFVKGNGVYWYTSNSPYTPILYLHQLQNLYFHLKSYELNTSYLIER